MTTLPPGLARPENRRQLKLLVQQLNDPDIARLATFLRVGGERLQSDWTIVYDGDADLMLLGNEEPDTVPGLLENPMATLRVVDAAQRLPGDTGQILRPLQYEPLIDALEEAERKIFGTRAAPPRIAPMDDDEADDELVVMRAPQSPQPFLADALSLAPGASFKLKRWPPASVLQRHRYCVRLASFLSARHVSLDELARLSNVEPRQCEDFVAKLIAVGILDVKLSNPVVRAPMVTQLQPSSAMLPMAARPAAPPAGLLHRMRRSLGIDR